MYYTRHCNHNRLLFSTRYPRQPQSTETQTSDRWHQSYLCSYRLGKNSLYKGSHRGLGVRGCSRSVRKVHGRLWSIVQGARYSLSDSFHLKAICSTAAASNNAVICFTLSRKTSDVPDEWQHLLRCAVASQQSGTLIHKANWWQTYCRYGHTSPILEKLSLGERRGYDRGRKKKKNGWVPGLWVELCGNWKLLRHFETKSGYYRDLSIVVLYTCQTLHFFPSDLKRTFFLLISCWIHHHIMELIVDRELCISVIRRLWVTLFSEAVSTVLRKT